MPLLLPLLPSGKSASRLLLAALTALPLLGRGQATCPPAASACTPGSAPAVNTAFGMGIQNVTLGGLNSTTAATDGYQNYACAATAAALTVGADAPISIRTNANSDENVRVWADLNNDGTFNPTTELVFSSDAKRLHTGSIRLPAGTVTGVRLRLRVAADYANSPVPTPCSTPQYSQTEDYSLVASAATLAPVASFAANQPRTCTGTVQFTDQSQNAPTSWQWNFGDGTTSTQQNPTHTYASSGTYTVSLTATNGAGSSTSTRVGYVIYDSALPAAAACTPATAAYCCGYGITRFTLGTFTNTSANGQAGYENFTCEGKLELTPGGRYPFSLVTSPNNPQDTRVWLDLNANGTFEAGELLFTVLNATNPIGTILLPATAPLNQPLRLRVISDYVGSPFTACGGVAYGQAEDYTVTFRANTSAPTAAFTSNYAAGSCQSAVQFTDQSQGVPTSWRWSFGDGTTSTQQNPSHTYAASGTYTVSLTATNAFGSNTTTFPNYITVSVPCFTYCNAGGDNANFWIASVSVTTPASAPFANASGANAAGYGNYIDQVIPLRQGQTSTLAVATNTTGQRVTSVWVDWNQDGLFTISELVLNTISLGTLTTLLTPPTTPSALGYTRMRVMARLNNNQPNACPNGLPANTEVEDYTVQVLSSTATAVAEAQSLPALSVFPNPVADGQLHLRLSEASAADQYQVDVENTLGARLQGSSLRLQAGADAVLDVRHLPAGLYVLRLRGTRGQQAVRRVLLQ